MGPGHKNIDEGGVSERLVWTLMRTRLSTAGFRRRGRRFGPPPDSKNNPPVQKNCKTEVKLLQAAQIF